MDLSTPYLGFTLPHPLLPGASPLVDDLDVVRRLEDAGAPAIVMHSLFEEQLAREQIATARFLELPAESSPTPRSYLPPPERSALGRNQSLSRTPGTTRPAACRCTPPWNA